MTSGLPDSTSGLPDETGGIPLTILDAQAGWTTVPDGHAASLAGSDALTRLRALFEISRELDKLIDAAAVEAWRDGETWASIGAAASMTRQSAHQRWHPAAEDSTKGAARDDKARDTTPAPKPRRRPASRETREEVEIGVPWLPFRAHFEVTRRPML